MLDKEQSHYQAVASYRVSFNIVAAQMNILKLG